MAIATAFAGRNITNNKGKADLITRSQPVQSQTVDQSLRFNPDALLGSFAPLEEFSAEPYSMSPPPQELVDQGKKLADATMLFVKGKNLYGKKFREKVAANMQSKADYFNKGFSEADRISLKNRGLDPNDTELLSALSKIRTSKTDRAINDTKLQMQIDNGLAKLKNKQWGIGQYLDMLASEKNIQAQAAKMAQETNQRLSDLSLNSRLQAMQGGARLNQEGINLAAQRDMFIQDLYQKKSEIAAARKRRTGSLFGKLFGSAGLILGGIATGGIGSTLGAGLISGGVGNLGGSIGDVGGLT